MGDMIADGAAHLGEVLNAHASTPVSYQREGSAVSLMAVRGRSEGFTSREYGARERWESHDFLIRVADLIFDDGAIEPRDGDEIIETVNGVLRTWRVLAPGAQEPCSRPANGRLMHRVHVKLFSEEPAT